MKKSILVASILSISLAGCFQRIETGEVGLRVGFDKQVSLQELQPGSFNQTAIGSVITFPVRDIRVAIDNMMPQTLDNSTLQDFDITLIYNINPASVGELYTTKSRGFHYYDEKDGDIYLMFDYVTTLARTAAYKAARKYESMKIADNRDILQADIMNLVRAALKEENLDTMINLTQVQVRSVLPNATIVASANAAINAQNELKAKATEVEIARKEAERISLLNANKGAVEYMNATANITIAEAVKAGKVSTIILPWDFKGMVNVGAK